MQQIPPYIERLNYAAKGIGKFREYSVPRGLTNPRPRFALCECTFSPLPAGSGFVFIDKDVDNGVQALYRPSVKQGILQAMKTGRIAGYPIIDMQVELTGGRTEPDSDEESFEKAGRNAFFNALMSISVAESVLKVRIMTTETLLPQLLQICENNRTEVVECGENTFFSSETAALERELEDLEDRIEESAADENCSDEELSMLEEKAAGLKSRIAGIVRMPRQLTIITPSNNLANINAFIGEHAEDLEIFSVQTDGYKQLSNDIMSKVVAEAKATGRVVTA
jgi:translation elongation factor EF-G